VQVVSSSGAVSPFLRELDVEPSADERVRSVVRSTVPATSGGGARRGGGTSGTAAAATADTVVLDALGEQLFELLRQFRNDVRNGKPAYTVFGDGTLQRIAASRPVTLDALARVKGVGPMKLEQYGDRLLAIVTAFVEAQG
jgi:ATP-dependent DNA helicase RecQ